MSCKRNLCSRNDNDTHISKDVSHTILEKLDKWWSLCAEHCLNEYPPLALH
jgi:hypothetical protein